MEYIKYIVPLIGLITLIYSIIKLNTLNKINLINDDMLKLSSSIEGSLNIFLKKFYKITLIYFIFMSVFIFLVGNLALVANFLAGGLFSIIIVKIAFRSTGDLGFKIAETSMVSGKFEAYRQIIYGSYALGLLLPAFSLLGLGIIMILFDSNTMDILAFIFGSSSVSLLSYIYIGILKKVTELDISMASFNLSESNLTKGQIMDLVSRIGAYANDIMSNSTDFFVTYSSLFFTSIAFGRLVLGDQALYFVLLIACAALISSIIGLELLAKNAGNERYYIRANLIIILFISFFGLIGSIVILNDIRYFIPVIIGSSSAFLYKTLRQNVFIDQDQEKNFADPSLATSEISYLLTGISKGFLSLLSIFLLIILIMLLSFYIVGGKESAISGIFGISLAGFSLVSQVAFYGGLNVFYRISSNTRDISNACKFPENISDINNSLNNMAYRLLNENKVFLVLTTFFTGFSLLLYYYQSSELTSIDMAKPLVFVGALIGIILLVISLWSIISSIDKLLNKNYKSSIEDKEDNNTIEINLSDSNQAYMEELTNIDISSVYIPIIFILITIFLLALIFGLEALGGSLIGFLIGGIATGILAIASGSYWYDTAYLNTRNTDNISSNYRYKASYIGSLFRETIGPLIFSLIKFLILLALLLTPVFSQFNGLI